MKTIGFIDLFIDEWHANNYPAWLREKPAFKDFALGYAWEEVPKDGGRPLAKWCQDFDMKPAASIAEVVDKSDCICVLAPSNPEVHERLAELPLKSGKPVYIDKPFADSAAAAKRLFQLATDNGTPLMSSSALRYGDQLLDLSAKNFSAAKATFAATTGGGRTFDEYGIHQLEMIVSQLGTGAEGVLCTHSANGSETYDIRYADNRHATMAYAPNFGFSFALANDRSAVVSPNGGDMFKTLLDRILQFFSTGISPIPKEETIEIAALLEASLKSRASKAFTKLDL